MCDVYAEAKPRHNRTCFGPGLSYLSGTCLETHRMTPLYTPLHTTHFSARPRNLLPRCCCCCSTVEILKVAPGFLETLRRGKTGNSEEKFPWRDVTPLTALVWLVFTISTALRSDGKSSDRQAMPERTELRTDHWPDHWLSRHPTAHRNNNRLWNRNFPATSFVWDSRALAALLCGCLDIMTEIRHRHQTRESLWLVYLDIDCQLVGMQ